LNKVSEEKIMGPWMMLQASDGLEFSVYVAKPDGQPRGAVVVLQEIFGVNAHIREVAQAYATAGYLAVAPATFHRVKPGVELGYTPEDMSAGSALKASVEALPAPGVMQDIEAAIHYAAHAGKVAVVGYCWGGLLTWRSACLLKGLSAAVPYYGGGMTGENEIARQPMCPVLAHFSDQDHWIPLDGVEAFKKAHPEVETYIYPAKHGFNCNHRAAYDAAAATLARERTMSFLAKHLE
jgi:carboxymethylenebutenolidase